MSSHGGAAGRRRRRVRVGKQELPKILALLAACPLYPETIEGQCAACSKPLPARRSRWCSRRCAQSWRENHVWSIARSAARRRDRYRCGRCGVRGKKRVETEGVHLEVNHRVPIATIAGATRGTASCVHHLENLETLCGACHAIETALQATERAKRRRAVATASATLQMTGLAPVAAKESALSQAPISTSSRFYASSELK